MSLFLGSIYSTLELDTSKLGGQVATGRKHIQGLGNDVEAFGNSSENSFGKLVKASAVGNLAAIGLSKGIETITGAAKDSFAALSQLQNSRASFEVLTGSAEGANKVMSDLANYANNTPFEFSEIARAGKTLLGFGIQAQDVGKYVRQLGDITGATGGDFYNISRVFGQVSAAGRLMTEDFNQLVDNGVALGDVLAKELGIPVKDLKEKMSEGAVTSEVFYKALEKATSQGGKFFGGAEKLAQTLNGRISTLNDTFTGLVGTIVGIDFKTGVVEADGAFAKLSDTIVQANGVLGSKGFGQFMKDARDNTFAFLGGVMQTGQAVGSFLAPAVMGLWSVFTTQLIPAIQQFMASPFVAYVGQTMVVAINLAILAVTGITSAIASFIGGASSATGILVGLVVGIAAYNIILGLMTAGTTVMTVAQGALNAVMMLNPYALLAAAAMGIVAAYVAVVSQSDAASNASKRLEDARNSQKVAADNLITSENNLRNAQMSAEGASLAVERAQRNYNDTVANYGPDALESREAAFNLKRAQDDLAKANGTVSDSTQKNKDANEELRKKNAEVEAAERAKKEQIEKTNAALKLQRDRLTDLSLSLDQLNGKQVNYKVNGSITNVSVGGQIGNRAVGGPVKRGMPYFVGENRDGSLNKTSELFVPKTSGSIVNSSDLQRMLRGEAPTSAPTGGTGLGSVPYKGSDEGNPFGSGNTFNLTLPNVENADDFAREFKLAVAGR